MQVFQTERISKINGETEKKNKSKRQKVITEQTERRYVGRQMLIHMFIHSLTSICG